jgi:hypothetical protein
VWGILEVGLASQLEVVQLVGSALGDRDAVVNLEAFGAAADDTHAVAAVDLFTDAAPFPP